MLEPGHVHAREHLCGAPAAGLERFGNHWQSRLAIRSADRLRPAIDSGHSRVTCPRRRHRDLRHLVGDERHVARDHEDRIVARSFQAGFDACKRPGSPPAVEHHPVRDRLLKLLGLSKSGDHLVELGGQPVGHPPQQDRVSHLEPRFRSTHPPARTPRKDEQRGVHGHYHPPAVRAIDFHVHLPTPEWLDGSMRGYIEAAEAYFRSTVPRRSLDELASDYEAIDVMAVLLAWDAETATGRPRVPNELVAQACRDHPGTFIGFGSVDPLKGRRAVDELDSINELGLKGVKLHPSLQAFAPDDEKHWPLYERCEELGLALLFHTGTSGIGAGQPGGQGIRLDYARPIRLDAVAASFPNLNIIAAHFGFPWHLELLAMALHKTNVYIDISGWAPKYMPPEVVRDLKGRLQNQFVFGSDYPFIQPKRCLDELQELGIGEDALQRVLVGNGKRLLGLS